MDAITTEKESYLRNFAERVFGVAENEYQSGTASKNTAKSFLHASVFFESLKHFTPLDTETLGRIRYSKWKATEIVNAIAEGRVPGPEGAGERSLDEEMNGVSSGGPVDVPDSPAFGNMSYAAQPPVARAAPTSFSPAPAPNKSLHDSGSDLDLPDVPVFTQSQLASQRSAQQGSAASSPGMGYGAGQINQAPSSSSSSPQFPAVPQRQSSNQMAVDPPAPVATHPQHPLHAAPRNNPAFNNFISSRVVLSPKPVQNFDAILEATKYSRNAISALQFDDSEAAIQNLRAALKVLTGSDH